MVRATHNIIWVIITLPLFMIAFGYHNKMRAILPAQYDKKRWALDQNWSPKHLGFVDTLFIGSEKASPIQCSPVHTQFVLRNE